MYGSSARYVNVPPFNTRETMASTAISSRIAEKKMARAGVNLFGRSCAETGVMFREPKGADTAGPPCSGSLFLLRGAASAIPFEILPVNSRDEQILWRHRP